MYKLLYHPRVEKFFRKITKDEAKRTIQKIELLATDPSVANPNIKKLTGSENSYRLRVGNIRVIYEINSASKTIYILDADFRGNIY